MIGVFRRGIVVGIYTLNKNFFITDSNSSRILYGDLDSVFFYVLKYCSQSTVVAPV